MSQKKNYIYQNFAKFCAIISAYATSFFTVFLFQLMQQKTERKIERTAVAIVACFIVTKVISTSLTAY